MDEKPDNDAPKHRRLWYQFSLRTLLIGVALLSVVCGYVRWQAEIVAARKEWMNNHRFELWQMSLRGNEPDPHMIAKGDPRQDPSWLRVLLGDKPRQSVFVPLTATTADKQRAAALFPEGSIFECPGKFYSRSADK